MEWSGSKIHEAPVLWEEWEEARGRQGRQGRVGVMQVAGHGTKKGLDRTRRTPCFPTGTWKVISVLMGCPRIE